MENRLVRWEELGMDCLASVFEKVGMESLLLNIPFVCKSWYKASLSPCCWLSLDFTEILTKYYYTWSESHDRFVKRFVDRSKGHATFLRLPGCCTLEAFKYVADVCPGLKASSLPSELVFLQPSMIIELIEKWENLESLSLKSRINIDELLSPISLHCKNFRPLDIHGASVGEDPALSIVKLVPNIEHLSLRGFGSVTLSEQAGPKNSRSFCFSLPYLTFKMENERRWEDLNVDCLVNVFGRVGMQSLLLDVPFVCKSWYTASLSPSCWECLIFPGGFDGFDLPTHDLWSSEGELRTFMDRFRCIYRIDEDRFSLTAFLKVVVNRSRGHATVVRLPGFCSSEAMKYVADVCPRLKALYVDKMIPELIGKWKDLKELFLGSSIGVEKTLSEIGIHCNNFWRLHVGNAYICNTEALAIVKLVPNIKHLSLRQADIERDNLVTILQGCKELVAFDVSDCRGFDEGDDEIYKLASHITNFRCEGSSSKYSSDSDDNLDRNPVYFFGYESD